LLVKGYYATVANISLTYTRGIPILPYPVSKFLSNLMRMWFQDIPLTVKKMIKIRQSRCTECQICMEICSWRHFGENTTKRSRICVEVDWPKAPVISVCLACKDHECAYVGPLDPDGQGPVRWLWTMCGSLSGKRNPYGFPYPPSADMRYLRR
jgi:hypothetical protein